MKNLKKIFAVAMLLAFLPLIVLAHAPDEAEEAIQGFEIELTPLQVTKGDAVPLNARVTKNGVPVRDLKVTLTVDKHDVSLSEKLATKERTPGHYFVEYAFAKAGEHEIHVEFASGGGEARKTINVNVVETQAPSVETLLLLAVLIALAIIWFYGLAGKEKKSVNWLVVLSIAAVVTAVIAYSLYVTVTTSTAQTGVVTCPTSSECFWTAHVHTYIHISACGEERRLPIEKGDLSGPHTHEEKNVVHWHNKLPYDKNSGKLLDNRPLKLGAFFDQMEIDFGSEKLLGKKNGDACPDGIAGVLKMFVNGKPNSEYREQVWRDRDVIALVFDNRTLEEAQSWLEANPVKFPGAGRG